MIKIAPSILAADSSCLGQQIKAVENEIDLLHLDIMDGHFVPNLTFGPVVVQSIRKVTKLPFDVHLMLRQPLDYIEPFAKAGADIITVHVEADSDTDICIQKIHDLGLRAGIVFNPNTPVEPYLRYLDKVEMVLIMSVYPGFGGQKFIADVLPKATRIRELMGPDFDIEIDGGINADTIKQAADAGVNIMVAGSSVFGASDPAKAARDLRNDAQ